MTKSMGLELGRNLWRLIDRSLIVEALPHEKSLDEDTSSKSS